ncbi:MAG: hypothetical protein E6G44_07590 [Actinobacteria bacterium]|nr:MAG: hypothetical protein E6G44_07590 [Actinomycetota bacterium]
MTPASHGPTDRSSVRGPASASACASSGQNRAAREARWRAVLRFVPGASSCSARASSSAICPFVSVIGSQCLGPEGVGYKSRMAAQPQHKRAGGESRVPVRIWLVPPPVRRRLPKRMLQFLLLPPMLAVALIAFLLTVGSTFGAQASHFVHSYTDATVPQEPPFAQTTYIYDRNGKLITTLHAEVNRTPLPLSQISPNLQHAAIAIEDKNFYRHGGVDFEALARASIADIRSGGIVQGGSTITQQYVKLVYTGSERTLSRKLKEAVLAEKISRMYTKNQILDKYLNLVYFGHGAYGAQAAAQTYFGVNAGKLTLGQAALLAGLIQAPADYDPARHAAVAKARRNLVLERMAKQGYMTRDLADRISRRPLQPLPPDEAGGRGHVQRRPPGGHDPRLEHAAGGGTRRGRPPLLTRRPRRGAGGHRSQDGRNPGHGGGQELHPGEVQPGHAGPPADGERVQGLHLHRGHGEAHRSPRDDVRAAVDHHPRPALPWPEGRVAG